MAEKLVIDKCKHFYWCDVESKAGKRLKKLMQRQIRVCERADDYAKKYGATEYEPPVQFYDGGIDYLLFGNKKPDPRVWRKRLDDAEGNGIYEPNCMVRSDILVLPDDRFHPSDTWNKTYGKDHLTWPMVKGQKPLAQWAAIIGYRLTDDKEQDAAAVELTLHNKTFVAFLEYYGAEPCKSKADAPQWLRKAIKAEKDRVALPVITVEEVFALLECDVPKEDPERSAFLYNMVTPIFFVHRDKFYIGSQCPCLVEGLHDSNKEKFIYHYNVSNREYDISN